jgi:hypothetical protein
MARPRKDRRLDASPEVVRAVLHDALEVDRRILDARNAINRMNVRMATQGVHPGVLAFCRRLAKLKPPARREAIALTRQYLAVLKEELAADGDGACQR